MDEVFALLLLMIWWVNCQLAQFKQVADVVRYLVSSSDLFWELTLMDHAFSSEEAKNKHVALHENRYTRRAEEVCILIGCSA